MAVRPTVEPGQTLRRRWTQLYYITHVDNVASILNEGILSHGEILRRGLSYTPVYNRAIVDRRSAITTPAGRSLWDYANVYLQPRNPMLFTVARSIPLDQVTVLGVQRGSTYYSPDAFITDGNAASDATKFYPIAQRGRAFAELKSVGGAGGGLEYWKPEDGSKRKIMAEVLVPTRIPEESILDIYVANNDVRSNLDDRLSQAGPHPPVIAEPYMFFQPDFELPLTGSLSLVRGDMFFSTMQTLTISVNTVGVMGKGLASRAKYQFPDLYVRYQDLCRSKALQLGKPVLYKRESSLDVQLADEPELIPNPESSTWFILFATKDDWRKPAKRQGIIDGLNWLEANYRSEGIRSLAVPALGCGLGWLSWSDIGPILCQRLARLEIPTQLYLPTETAIPPDQLSPAFLLGSSGAGPVPPSSVQRTL